MNTALKNQGIKELHLGQGTEYIPFILINGETIINLDYKKEDNSL